MTESLKDIIVVGQGAAGLAAALAAAQAGRGVRVTLVDKAPEGEAGGNTRWSPSYMRMASVDRVEPSFVHDMLAATEYHGDETYFATLAHHAGHLPMDRGARRRVHPADLLSGERPAAHSAARRRSGRD